MESMTPHSVIIGVESMSPHSKNKIVENGVDIPRENWKFTVRCSHAPLDLKFDHFTSLSRQE